MLIDDKASMPKAGQRGISVVGPTFGQEFKMLRLSKKGSVAAVLAVLGIAAATASANATPMSTSPAALSFTTTPSGSNGGPTGWDFTGTIPQFTITCPINHTCTLTGVSVTVTDSSSGSVVFTDPTHSSGAYVQNYFIGSQIQYLYPFDNTTIESPLTASYELCTANVSLSGGSCGSGLNAFKVTVADGQTVTATMLNTPVGNATYSTSDSSVLSQLLAGTMSFDGTTSSYTSGTNINNVNVAPTVTASVSGTVTYTYDDVVNQEQNPIPEPASLVLLGVGFAGLSVMRRRQRQA